MAAGHDVYPQAPALGNCQERKRTMAGEVRSQVRRPLNLFFYIYMCPFSGFWEISMLRSSLGPCREGFTWFLVVMRRIPAGRRLSS